MNPPPTHTHKVESWLLYPNKPQWESRNTPAQTNVDFSDYTQTHTHTGICTHIDAHCKDGTNTITHSRFSTQPRAESRWEKNKSGNKGGGGNGARGRSEKKRWCEGKQVTTSAKHLDSQSGPLREFSLTSSEGNSNPPICHPNTLADPSFNTSFC